MQITSISLLFHSLINPSTDKRSASLLSTTEKYYRLSNVPLNLALIAISVELVHHLKTEREKEMVVHAFTNGNDLIKTEQLLHI